MSGIEPGPERRCALPGCEAQFTPPPWAPHKIFCCEAHRKEFHKREAKAALAVLRTKQEPETDHVK